MTKVVMTSIINDNQWWPIVMILVMMKVMWKWKWPINWKTNDERRRRWRNDNDNDDVIWSEMCNDEAETMT